MLQTQEELLNILDELKINYTNHEHPAVFTVEEAARHSEGIEGAHSKNLFFKDKKRDCFWWSPWRTNPSKLKMWAN